MVSQIRLANRWVSTQPYPHSKMQNAKTYLPIPGSLMAENRDEALGRSVLCERRTARFSSRGEATLQLYIVSGITEEQVNAMVNDLFLTSPRS
jgi:hypothetical protein